jgi:hypothetical protein
MPTTPPEDRPSAEDSRPPREPRIRAARCPKQAANCAWAVGRVIYIESVDPDGDGDLHVVVNGGGISLPGLTAVDVRPGLRPRRDPRPGDRVTAAGPVQRGSFGQDQIHALQFRVQTDRG